jgi:hypothetical protein
MIQHYFRFLFFKLKATNQHGVHSPFLYALVCFCFYNTSRNRKKFKPWKSKMHNLIAIEISKQLQQFAKQASTDFQIDPLKVIHIRNKTLAQWIEEQKIEDEPHITLIDNLHLQRRSWNGFKIKSQYILLDLFFYGIVIHRPQQTAETFFLKVF